MKATFEVKLKKPEDTKLSLVNCVNGLFRDSNGRYWVRLKGGAIYLDGPDKLMEVVPPSTLENIQVYGTPLTGQVILNFGHQAKEPPAGDQD